MSQSPLDLQNLNSLPSYQKGWQVLSRLLHENRSFSGRETNNAFLNCGNGGRFADVSTAIGWDFSDDARAIGLIDYDHDGDLDLWVANRTAPRLRLLKNNLQSDSTFLSLHLTGTAKTTPRDAIGARVEVHLQDQPVILRSLHAGQSFLSQSSRWLHFGLGENPTIQKVIVHWPGAASQTFTGLYPGQSLHLTQGSPTATPRKKTPPITLTPSEQLPHPTSSIARIIPPAGIAVPELKTANDHLMGLTQTTLISLWSRTCPHCQEELTSWAKEADLWEEIKVILLSTDQEPRAQCDAFLKSIGANFTAEMASPEAIELLDALQASIVDLWLPIPVPTSFLVTKEGELLAIYRGPVTRQQVLADSHLAGTTPTQRRAAGTPFPGRWTGDPIPATPQRTTKQLVARAFPETAIHYLRGALAKPFVKGSKYEQSNSYLLLGQLLGQNGRPAEAIPPLRQALALTPTDIRAARLLATGLTETKQHPEALIVLNQAIQQHPKNTDLHTDASRIALTLGDQKAALLYLEKAVTLSPTNPELRYHLTSLQLQNNLPAKAIANCKTSLRTNPKFLKAAELLAIILSTHPNDQIRSAEEAHALASRLCQISKNTNANHLLTLAYAQANLGNYPEATATLTPLKTIAPADSPFTKNVLTALKNTQSNQPIRNPTWK